MAAITVTGVRELQTALKRLGEAEASAQLKGALHDAADLVAVRARGKVPSRSGRAAGSIKSGASGTSSYVKGGGGSVPYYGWLDFGTRNPVYGNSRNVGPWSGSGHGPDKGRFIYPALDENKTKVLELISKGIGKLVEDAGLSGG